MKLVDVKKKLEGKVYRNTLVSGEALCDECAPRVSTGCLVMDVIYGGGMPLGKINVFWGDKSSGKTTAALRIAGSFLKTFANRSVVWCDMEHAYEHSWATNFIGENKNRFHLIKPDFGEEAVDLAVELIQADDAGMLVFDSIGAIYSTAESEGDAGDMFVAGQSRLTGRLIKKLAPLVGRSVKDGVPKLVLIINQVRARFGAQAFGAQSSPTGGKHLGHTASTEAHFYLKEVKKMGGLPTISAHSFVLEKNRLGLSRRTGEFAFYQRPYNGKKAGELEETKTTFDLGKRIGVIEKSGAQIEVAGKKFPTYTAVLEAMADPKFETVVRTKVLDAWVKNPYAAVSEEDE